MVIDIVKVNVDDEKEIATAREILKKFSKYK
jgi:hypothetical protein